MVSSPKDTLYWPSYTRCSPAEERAMMDFWKTKPLRGTGCNGPVRMGNIALDIHGMKLPTYPIFVMKIHERHVNLHHKEPPST